MSRIILTEGPDDDAFFAELIRKYRIAGCRLFESDGPRKAFGVGSFKALLKSIDIGSNYDKDDLVIVAADNDDDHNKSFRTVCSKIRQSGLYAVPQRPCEVAREAGKRAVVVLMLPWANEKGSVETICYDLARRRKRRLAGCIESYLDCAIDRAEWSAQMLSKLKLRCLMAASSPKQPNTGMQYAWSKRHNRRPPDLIPLDSRCACIKRILHFLKGLPAN